MGRIRERLRGTGRALLALVICALVPAAAAAAGIGYRNDAPYPVYVQWSMMVNGQVKRGPLVFIKPGQTSWDVNLMKANLTITVYSTGNQRLYQNTHMFQGKDQLFQILPVLVPRGQPPRADLRELPLPKK